MTALLWGLALIALSAGAGFVAAMIVERFWGRPML